MSTRPPEERFIPLNREATPLIVRNGIEQDARIQDIRSSREVKEEITVLYTRASRDKGKREISKRQSDTLLVAMSMSLHLMCVVYPKCYLYTECRYLVK